MRPTMVRRALAVSATCLAAFTSRAGAQFVTPVSYTATAGEGTAQGGTYNYFDDGGRQLTDGIVGANDWRANLGTGAAYEWVGWRVATPALVFTFGAPVTITQVQIGFNRAESAGIFVPSTVTIGGTRFDLAASALADGTRGFLTFNAAFAGSNLTIGIDDADPARWIFVDEVRFVGTAASVVPEPSTDLLVVTGLVGVAVWRRRQARAR